MKNTLILIAFISLLFTSCADDEYEAPNSFSDVGFYTGAGQSSTLQLNINDYLSFLDLSQGYTEHSWTIEKGNNFLDGAINSRETSFEQYIVNDGDTVTKEKTAHVLFNNSGLQKVRLRNVFKDSVAFRGSSFERGEYTMASVKEGNFWVIDTTFVVDIFSKIIPKVQIDHANGTETFETPELTDTDGSSVNVIWDDISVISNNVITVEAGGSVDFTDITEIGRPEAVTWKRINANNVNGNTLGYESNGLIIGNGTDFSHTFSSLGDYYIGARVARSSQDSPNASTSVVLPYRFNVIPSSLPFTLSGAIRELEDETIQIPYNGEFVAFANKSGFFEVKVNDVIYSIASVAVDDSDATFINIKLDDPIYQDDEIKVTWLAGSEIMSTDTREPVLFTDSVVKPFVEEYLLSEGMFENNLDTDWNKPFLNATVDGITEVLIVDPPTSTPTAVVPTGKVINLALNRNGGTVANNVRTETSNTEVKLIQGRDYVVKFKYLVRSGSANILFRFSNLGGANQLNFNPGSANAANVDIWKEAEYKFKALATHNGKFSVLSAWKNYADFYVDDLVIMSDEKRP